MKIQLPDHAKLRIYRLQQGMSMEALAHTLGISLSYYSRMEGGLRPVSKTVLQDLELDRVAQWLTEMLETHHPFLVKRLLKCLKLGDDYVIKPD